MFNEEQKQRMEPSDHQQQQQEQSSFIQQHHQQRQMNSGLTRYQSAPSSFFSNILDRDFCDDFFSRPSSPETEQILAGLLDNSVVDNNNDSNQIKQEQFMSSPILVNNSNNNNNNNSNSTRFHQQQQQQQGFYQNQLRPPLADHNSGSGMEYRAVTSVGMERLQPVKLGGGNNSNLVRHSSSPAGLFSNINIEFENGYAVLRESGDYGGGNNRNTSAYSTGNRLSHSSVRMSPISELRSKNMSENGLDDGGFREAHSENYVSGYPSGLWDDSSTLLSEDITDNDRTLSGGFTISEMQDEDAGKPPRMLAHHLSLPKTEEEMSTIEKYLQLQDSVPCKTRAKRGCATHPRSIAERVRRTKISERMRKLQDLVPNMDKQTNTADMLDLAVHYIKDLQGQVKTLSEDRAHCTCINNQQA